MSVALVCMTALKTGAKHRSQGRKNKQRYQWTQFISPSPGMKHMLINTLTNIVYMNTNTRIYLYRHAQFHWEV